MIQQQKLEDLIREKIPFGSSDSRGFYSLKCGVCNDYKVRAGFKFENSSIIYNCWNCSTAAVYEEFSGKISKNFRKILNAYSIEDSDISTVINTAFFNKKEPESKTITLASLVKINTSTPEIKLPPKSFPLGHDEFIDYQSKLVDYLTSRGIDIMKYKFYFSLEERFKDRIIIPFYRDGKLIFWQARSIDSAEKKRYDNAIVPRTAVMFNMDKLNHYSPGVLFVVEGIFDAMPIDGVAILGSALTEAKIELLKKSNRKLIFVIDKDDNGRHVAEIALKHGWGITFAPDNANDVSNSIQRYGIIWTVNELMKKVCYSKDDAELAINLNCR